MTPDIIELFKSVCEKMRKADYVEARSDMLQALERFECSKPQAINWIKCSDRMPEINVESIEMSGARVMSNLKKLTQSVFDGLPPEYKFAAVDANGFAWAYEERPDMISFDGMRRFISGNVDATDWQNSLIERKEIADDLNQEFESVAQLRAEAQKPQPMQRGDLVEFCGDAWVVLAANHAYNGYWIHAMTGNGGQDYVKAKDLTRIGSIRKKIKRLKAQMEGAK